MRYLIAIFISSLLLFVGLFYYWQKQSDFDKEIERVEIRLFFNGDRESIITSVKGTENVKGVDEVEMAEIKRMLEGYIGEEIEGVSLPSLLRVYPLNKGENEIENLAQKLKKIDGVVDVVYGKTALLKLWQDIKELRTVAIIVGSFFFLIFIFSIVLYTESTSVMRNWKVISTDGKSLFWLKLRLVFNTIAATGGSAVISIVIVYLSLLYTSPITPFIPINWVYYFVLGLVSVGILISISKRFHI